MIAGGTALRTRLRHPHGEGDGLCAGDDVGMIVGHSRGLFGNIEEFFP